MDTPINTGIARVVLCVYLLWKILTTRWERVYLYPAVNPEPQVAPLDVYMPEIVLSNITVVSWITGLFLVLFMGGVYMKGTGFISSFLVIYLGTIHQTVDTSWSTHMYFVAGLLIMLYAMYAEEDEFSVDGFRRQMDRNLRTLNQQLENQNDREFQSTPLRIFLLSLGIIYAGAGFGKLVYGGVEWMTATTQGRHMESFWQIGYYPQLGELMAQSNFVLASAAIGTVVLQIGLLISTLLGVFLSLTVFSLIVFHVGTAIVMGPVFVYSVVFFILVLDFEKLISRFETGSDIEVFYNDRDPFLVRSLHLISNLSATNNITYRPYGGRGQNRINESADSGDGVSILFANSESCGYCKAYAQLCRHVGVLLPLYPLLKIFTYFYGKFAPRL